MQVRVFIEKKPKYDDRTRRIYHLVTERLHMHGVTAVRTLRCLLIDGLADGTAFGVPPSLYMDAHTETELSEQALAETVGDGVFSIATVSLFATKAEKLAEAALRTALDGAFLRQVDVYLFSGVTTDAEREALRRYFVNPASRVELPLPDLFAGGALPPVYNAHTMPEGALRGFNHLNDELLLELRRRLQLSMSGDDIRFVQSYFTVAEKRDPTLFELRCIDTYWSDHCRHITFLTAVEDVHITDRTVADAFARYLSVRESLYGTRAKPVTLMDIATLAAKYLRRTKRLPQYAEVGENNVSSMRIGVRVTRSLTPELPDSPKTVDVVPWLLHFKNEAHNYPTERDPYLGAASGVGATIGDPLAARGNVFALLRVSGSAEPQDESRSLLGRIPQYRMSLDSADGFAAFAAQCGLGTGEVYESRHEGFAARHMEICMAVAAVPEADFISQLPTAGDAIMIVGAPTGQDGMGGALSASDISDVPYADSEVGAAANRRFMRPRYTAQVSDAVVERALIRYMRTPYVQSRIKRANDVGAGGLAVAAAELAEGVRIDLERVPTVMSGVGVSRMSPYEIAASETLQRLVLVIPSVHREGMVREAQEMGLSAAVIGTVTAERRFRMLWRGRIVLSLTRDFLESMGAQKRISAEVRPTAFDVWEDQTQAGEDMGRRLLRTLMSPSVCSQKPLSARFDHTAGGGTALYPFGGKYMLTPLPYTAMRIPVREGEASETTAVFACGYLPTLLEKSPYHGAYLSVLHSICKLAAAGISLDQMSLSLQEYFPAPRGGAARFGMAFSAMLGAFCAQMDYGVAAVGGKDSMSGTDELGDVPPTVISFAAASVEQSTLCTPELKKSGSRVWLLAAETEENGLPSAEDQRGLFAYLASLHASGKVLSCMALGEGGIVAAVSQMCFGNRIGFNFHHKLQPEFLFRDRACAFLVESDEALRGTLIGETKDTPNIFLSGSLFALDTLIEAWMRPQTKLYRPSLVQHEGSIVAPLAHTAPPVAKPAVITKTPSVLLPVFAGTSGEDVLAARFAAVGITPNRFYFSFTDSKQKEEEIRAFCKALADNEILAFAGGSYPVCGGMPDAAASYVGAFFAEARLANAMRRFRRRESSLLLGIGEGFADLLAIGAFSEESIGTHTKDGGIGVTLAENPRNALTAQMVRIKIMSVSSPWMHSSRVGEIYTLPIASCAGRCLFSGEDGAVQAAVGTLAKNGQIAAQYVDENGNPTMARAHNPFASEFAVEGIFSKDGRVYGRMAHCECVDNSLCINVPGEKEHDIFSAALRYYKII